MFDFLGEILLGIVIAVFEALGDIVFEEVMEAIAKTPIAVWSTLRSFGQELWR